MVIRLKKFGSIRSSSFRAEGCEAPLERRGSLVEASVGAAEGHFGPNRSSDQPGGRPAVRCSSKFRNWQILLQKSAGAAWAQQSNHNEPILESTLRIGTWSYI